MLISLILFLLAMPVHAQMPSEVVEGQLLTGWREDDGSHVAAVRLRLDSGWKTYWRVPGDAGIPPSFDFSGSENLVSAAPHWPVPEVFWQSGMRSIGYSDRVTIPIRIRTRSSGPITLRARMEIGVCREICLPVSLELFGILPDGKGSGQRSIQLALMDRPEQGKGRLTCRAEPIEDGLRLTVAVDLPVLGAGEETVIEVDDPAIWVSEPVVRREGGRLFATADLVQPSGKPFAFSRQGVRLTVFAGTRAIEIFGCEAG